MSLVSIGLKPEKKIYFSFNPIFLMLSIVTILKSPKTMRKLFYFTNFHTRKFDEITAFYTV